MATPNAAPSLHELSFELHNIQATRFVSAAGLVMLLYDHMLTFSVEVELVWKAPSSLPKFLFLCNRYFVPASLIINAYQLSGLSQSHLTPMFCRVWFSLGIYIGIISLAFSNFIILLRLWLLWDSNPRLMRWTLCAFLLTQLGSLAGTTFSVANMIPKLTWNDDLHLCTFTTKPDVAGLWAPGIAFEVMIFATTCWNAFDRPRGVDASVAHALYRDGLVYFLVLMSMRVLNLVLAVVAPVSLLFLVIFFVWSTTTLTLSRLILHVREASVQHKGLYTSFGERRDLEGWRGAPGLELTLTQSQRK